MKMSTPIQHQQWLVTLNQKTHVLSLPLFQDEHQIVQEACEEIAVRTGWPSSSLIVQSHSLPWIHLRVQSSIRGGKGGFGTLLRSSARQSGAKLTTDFGACRDLQGRRLRHVNDEIKLRKWREAQQQAKAKGDKSKSSDITDALFDTPSGLYNWHLMVPSWADISKKSSRKIQRQFRRMQQEEDNIENEKKEKRAQYERSITMYVQKATETSKEVKSNMMSAVKQGLQAQNEKKRKRQEEQEKSSFESAAEMFQNEDRPNSLCSLSGDVVVEETRSKVFQIQSQSDFATLALFLDKNVEKFTENKDSEPVLYYEVRLVTGGLAQIGWADITSADFHPNTEEGEGVGDDKGSYGYDGSRKLKFHNGSEEEYGDSKAHWKSGDVVGCCYNLQSGEISYNINGDDQGVAFTVEKSGIMMFPALSSNGGEILELHIGANEMEHLPESGTTHRYIPVRELVTASSVTSTAATETIKEADNNEMKVAAKNEAQEATIDDEGAKLPEDKNETAEETKKQVENDPVKKQAVKAEALDLNQFNSAAELEALGLDRLKGALLAIGVKCGGSLKERAARLFSLKGIERKDFPAKVRAKNFVA